MRTQLHSVVVAVSVAVAVAVGGGGGVVDVVSAVVFWVCQVRSGGGSFEPPDAAPPVGPPAQYMLVATDPWLNEARYK